MTHKMLRNTDIAYGKKKVTLRRIIADRKPVFQIGVEHQVAEFTGAPQIEEYEEYE